MLTEINGCREAEGWGQGGKAEGWGQAGKAEVYFSCKATEEI